MYTGDLGSDRSLLGWVRKMAGEDGDLPEASILKSYYNWIKLDNIGHNWTTSAIIGNYWEILEKILTDYMSQWWTLHICAQILPLGTR